MDTMPDRLGTEYLEFPAGAAGSLPDTIDRREIVLGEDTTNTCNIALAANVTTSPCDNIVIVGHTTSRIDI